MKIITRVSDLRPLIFGLGFCVFATSAATVTAAPPQKKQPRVVREIERVGQKVGDVFFKVARKLEQTDLSEPNPPPARRYTPTGTRTVTVETIETTSVETSGTGLTLPPGYPQQQGYPPGYQQRSTTYYVPRPGVTAVIPRPSAVQVPSQRRHTEEAFVPPDFQANPQPGIASEAAANRSRLSIPVRPSSPPQPQTPVEHPSLARDPFPQREEAPPMQPEAPPPTLSSQRQEAGEEASAPPSSPSTAVAPAARGGIGFATPIPGRPGFVYPPGAEHDIKYMVDVRDFVPGQKVRDPRTGEVFLVPPK